MKKNVSKVTSYVLLFAIALSVFASGMFNTAVHAAAPSLSGSGGWNETAFVEWSPVSNAQGYNVFVKPASAADSQYVQIDTELIRQYPTYWRADAVGLAAGSYVMKVEAILSGGSSESTVSGTISVTPHDRSGFAFASQSPFSTGSGAYNEDGTLRNGAQVIYVTSATAQTVSLDVITSSSGTKQTGVGIGPILALRQKGYDKTPLAIRFIGKVTDADMGSSLNSSGFLQVKGNSSYTEMNTTVEGIGKDATVYGWGFLLRNVGNVEVRNLGILLFQDDAVSMDTGNVNVWVHNNDITYGKAGSDADQAKGDGSTDLKGASTYTTISYNHYWDSGKAALIGLSESSEFFVTFHHNWFDHSDSRHPRIRKGTIHVYNNFFDGVSKYGSGMTTAGSAFVESNYYRHSKNPMLISLQGTDISGGSPGTFSGENGGMIKAYNNSIVDLVGGLIYANSNEGSAPANATSFDAYLASTRNETVPSSYKALVGGTAYNNFDTTIDTGVNVADIDSVSTVEQVVTAEAGRLGSGDFTWTFNDAVDDTSSDLNSALMSKILSYTSQLVSIGGNSTATPPTPTPPTPTPPTPTPPAATPTPPTSTPTPTPTPPGPSGSTIVHNFTTDGKASSFFNIQGNLSTSKGTVIFNGLTLTQCLKMESTTSIGFTTTTASTLTLVLNTADGTKIKVDGTSYPMTNGIVTVSLAPGAHTITKTDVTNLFYMKLTGVESDTTPPGDATFTANVTTPTNTNVNVIIQYPDDAAVKEYKVGIEGTWLPYTTPIIMATNNTIFARSTDTVGNTSNVSSYNVSNIDKTPPAVATLSADVTSLTNMDVTVTISYPLDATVKEYKLGDNGTWTAYVTPVVVSEISTVYARATDAAGNVSNETNYTVSNIDHIAPIDATLAVDTTVLTNQDVTVTINYPADASSMEYKLGANGAWTPYTEPVVVSDNDTVFARGIDAVGNISNVTSLTVSNIQKIAPVTTATLSPAAPNGKNSWYMTDVTVNFSISASVNGGSVTTEYQVNDGDWIAYTGFIPAFSDGTYKLGYRSKDQAGNVENLKTIEFYVDKTAPVLTVQLDKTSIWPANHKMVTIDATLDTGDATSGVESVVLTSITSNQPNSDSSDIQVNFGTAATSFSLRAEKARIYTITYTATDKAGNKTVTTATVTVPHDQSVQ
ncbi:hypothetical protein PAECIP111891_01058 [Paenibacillus allorhizoplanae]|uniref:Pectate lyase domain-containing protein n=1 Tax=Paenibacillus allorhizoplanae TaxID=2905648 RepID=A0ABM9BZB4_9BACL|nr:hypothetical protein PAECIP111891_01058 [Paenibacillus allorhizoplanae]